MHNRLKAESWFIDGMRLKPRFKFPKRLRQWKCDINAASVGKYYGALIKCRGYVYRASREGPNYWIINRTVPVRAQRKNPILYSNHREKYFCMRAGRGIVKYSLQAHELTISIQLIVRVYPYYFISTRLPITGHVASISLLFLPFYVFLNYSSFSVQLYCSVHVSMFLVVRLINIRRPSWVFDWYRLFQAISTPTYLLVLSQSCGILNWLKYE